MRRPGPQTKYDWQREMTTREARILKRLDIEIQWRYRELAEIRARYSVVKRRIIDRARMRQIAADKRKARGPIRIVRTKDSRGKFTGCIVHPL